MISWTKEPTLQWKETVGGMFPTVFLLNFYELLVT